MAIKSGTGAFWTLLIGAALGAGATLLLTPERERVKASLKAVMQGRKEGIIKSDKETEGTHCAVPEGADVCFPEK